METRLRTHAPRHSAMPRPDNWYHRNRVRDRDTYVAYARRWRTEERATQMDSLLPGCDEYSLLGIAQRVRSMSSRGQGCGTLNAVRVTGAVSDATSQNQMNDALAIWDQVCHSQWFKNTSIVSLVLMHRVQLSRVLHQILFLNKVDIFTKKIGYSHIRSVFPVRSLVPPFPISSPVAATIILLRDERIPAHESSLT
jgi:hypothetical protein